VKRAGAYQREHSGWYGNKEPRRKCGDLSNPIGYPRLLLAREPSSARACRTMKTQSGESQRGRPAPPLKEILPAPDTERWVARRKAAVVAAVRSGEITIEHACRVYHLSQEEFLSWARAFEIHGLAGLRATRIQQYRAARAARAPFTAAETGD
jgi:Protein of unknown function (DUF1153)